MVWLFHKQRSNVTVIKRLKKQQGLARCVTLVRIKDDAELDTAIRGAKLLGSRNITGDATSDMLARIDQRCGQEGLTFGIHNHFFKGEKFGYESWRMFSEQWPDSRTPSAPRRMSGISHRAAMTPWTPFAN